MSNTRCWIVLGLLSAFAAPAMAQSFLVQCPTSTITHPNPANNNSEPAYTAPTTLTPLPAAQGGYLAPTANVNGAIKCQQISGGDGYATMADGTQTYLFSFGPLSGLGHIANGEPATEFPSEFNFPFPASVSSAPLNGILVNNLVPGDPATSVDAQSSTTISGGFVQPLTAGQKSAIPGFYNGAVGLTQDVAHLASIYDIFEGSNPAAGVAAPANTVTVITNTPLDLNLKVGDQVVIGGGTDVPAGYKGTFPVTAINIANNYFPGNYAFQYTISPTGLADVLESPTASAATPRSCDLVNNTACTGHVDPRQIMDVGVMNGNIPAPLMAIDEDDEYFLTLTNVGMIMRPDLFEQHTVHFHGYPNASAFYDGVPDASVAINIGASFTYYYLAPDAGTYFWHCHITPPEHLQMGMVGQLFVRPRQNRVPPGTSLYSALQTQERDLRTACRRPGDVSAASTNPLPVSSDPDILCSNPVPAVQTSVTGGGKYAYNDGDGSTYYDVEYPLQIHGFDPNFHFVGMTFNPEGFADMKDKYFLLNGRSYPDTVNPDPLQTQSADGVYHFSQPLPAIITIPAGKRALLRISDLDVSEYQTLASLGVPMQVVGYNAKLLRDQAGNNLYYTTNSITLGGGESLDAILDTCVTRTTPGDPSSACSVPLAKGTYYLYTPNLDHLSNDAENFGGLMTEVRVN
jgi:FtsP/CotA-like multicopper oxidase with cupredoxin domain